MILFTYQNPMIHYEYVKFKLVCSVLPGCIGKYSLLLGITVHELGTYFPIQPGSTEHTSLNFL